MFAEICLSTRRVAKLLLGGASLWTRIVPVRRSSQAALDRKPRAFPAQDLVFATGAIEAFDVVEARHFDLARALSVAVPDQFGLQRFEEAFDALRANKSETFDCLKFTLEGKRPG